MSRKDKKDFSDTDFNFKMDLDIEKHVKEETPNTLEYDKESDVSEEPQGDYGDEISRKEVANLYMRTKDKYIRESTESYDDDDYDKKYREITKSSTKDSNEEFHIKLTQTSDLANYYDKMSEQDDNLHLDQEYMLNLLKESHREDDAHLKYRDGNPLEDPLSSDRSEKRRPANNAARRRKAYSLAHMAVTLLFVCFFGALGFLAYKTNSLSRELYEASLTLTYLRHIEERYYVLQADLEANAQMIVIEPIHEPTEDIDSHIDLVEIEVEPIEIGPIIHVVRRGDSLWRISELVYGDGSLYEEIMRANNIRTPEDIHEGMELIIPEL